MKKEIKQKLGPIQKKWVKALRSGKYKQTNGKLRDERGFCCLGVACEVVGMKAQKNRHGEYLYGKQFGITPETARRAIKLRNSNGTPCSGDVSFSLTELNDEKGYSFSQIADVLEQSPEAYFRKPA